MSRTLVLALVLATWPALAAADPARQEARALFEEGKRHFEAGDYVRAIEAWRASHQRVAAPRLLWNIGQAYRLAGDCAHALYFYAAYQAAEPATTNAKELELAVELCAGVAPATDDGESTPSSAVPPPPANHPDAPAPPVAPPANATPRLHVPGMTVVTRHDAANGEQRGARIGAGLALGASGAALIGAGYFGWRARSLQLDVAEGRGEWDAAAQDRDARGRRAARLAAGLGVVGGAAAITGAALVWWSRRDRGDRGRPAHVTFAVHPEHVGVEVACEF